MIEATQERIPLDWERFVVEFKWCHGVWRKTSWKEGYKSYVAPMYEPNRPMAMRVWAKSTKHAIVVAKEALMAQYKEIYPKAKNKPKLIYAVDVQVHADGFAPIQQLTLFAEGK